jgi:serine/threonine protein kinase
VILFEMLNGQTPFHARNRDEFNSKVEASNYSFKDSIMENLTMESILFLSQCLQHNENDRKCVSELVYHPYITKPFDEQQKLSSKHLSMIFSQAPADSLAGSTNKKRATSAAPALKGGPVPKLL